MILAPAKAPMGYVHSPPLFCAPSHPCVLRMITTALLEILRGKVPDLLQRQRTTTRSRGGSWFLLETLPMAPSFLRDIRLCVKEPDEAPPPSLVAREKQRVEGGRDRRCYLTSERGSGELVSALSPAFHNDRPSPTHKTLLATRLALNLHQCRRR